MPKPRPRPRVIFHAHGPNARPAGDAGRHEVAEVRVVLCPRACRRARSSLPMAGIGAQSCSDRRRKVKARLARQLQSVANTRDTHLHRVSVKLSREHRLIVLEDLRIANMTRSVSDTDAVPGTNVAQKRGLSSSILAAGWAKLVQMTRYKATRAGGELVCVDARGTSQECRRCGRWRRSRCPCAGTPARAGWTNTGRERGRGDPGPWSRGEGRGRGGQPLGSANVGHRAVRRPGRSSPPEGGAGERQEGTSTSNDE